MTCGEKIGQAQRKPPMGTKVCRHRGNTQWVSNYLGTKETPMGIKLFTQKRKPHGHQNI